MQIIELESKEVPEMIRKKWHDIRVAANQIRSWFDGYTHGQMGVDSLPNNLPQRVPYFMTHGAAQAALDAKHITKKQATLHVRSDWREEGKIDHDIDTLYVGSFMVFCVTAAECSKLNEGYEEQAGTENERIIEDGDNRIVVVLT